MVIGKKHGDLAELIAEQIKTKRRIAAGLEPPPQSSIPQPVKFSPEEQRRRELAGGLVIVGRNTFKELMHGLKRGWTDPLDKVDKEAQLAHELELDGAFDEPNEPDVSPSGLGADGEPIPTPSRLQSSNTPVPIFSPLQAQMRAMDKPAAHIQQEDTKPNVKAVPAHLNAPPALIPRLPPLLLVAHTNLIGLSQIPHMLWDFVNERHRVRAGAEAGLRLVYSQTRPFIGPSTSIPASSETLVDPAASPDSTSLSIPTSDLDFDRLGESYYKSSLNDWPSEVEKARKTYYTELSKKLETARALARRTREPTKDELANPPPTEQELRQERMKKEQRWRADMKGWSIIKPDAEVEWDERFRDALSVFADPPSEEVNERTA
jgi:mitochondrial import inner membrane translocase subunit TIM54